MNKHDTDQETWARLQEKSKLAWGSRWRFKKIARRRGLSVKAIETLIDQTLIYLENLRNG